MIDARWQKLADVLVHHSVRVQPGDKVLIEAFDMPPDFVALLMRTISDAGGIPIAETKTTPVLRALYQNATEEQIRFIAGLERQRMEGVQGYIGLRGTPNFAEMSDVPQEKMRLIRQLWWVPVHQEVRVPRTRWVVLRWPTVGMAQAAGMSTEAFEDFYFRVCTLDYAKMERDVQPLVELMERTREVHIKGPGTDLRFSIEGIGGRALLRLAQHSRRRVLHLSRARLGGGRNHYQHQQCVRGQPLSEYSLPPETGQDCGSHLCR
ncbi:MAG: hypothetical protein KatS3mg021_0006 [Fimbriimonadales bacterium]|nr:MAG: hypothetical protein KatS3mg021_0006 [Fimbriimonadales bacterium]